MKVSVKAFSKFVNRSTCEIQGSSALNRWFYLAREAHRMMVSYLAPCSHSYEKPCDTKLKQNLGTRLEASK